MSTRHFAETHSFRSCTRQTEKMMRSLTVTNTEHNYGFRPGRSAHQAVAQAQAYVAEGYEWVVDIDLEKFFDRVNYDILMDRVARRISDKRLLRLIRAYLNAGVMEDGLVRSTDEGVPQGGPLYHPALESRARRI